MIQPHELTIGSYFTPTSNKKILIPSGEPLKVGALLFDGVQVIDPHRADMPVYKYKEIFPIPLTHDLLVKAGFVKDYWRKDNLVFYFWDSGIRIEILPDGSAYLGYSKIYTTECQCSDSIEIPCLYLHQLQQLIFVLTGEPLKIEL